MNGGTLTEEEIDSVRNSKRKTTLNYYMELRTYCRIKSEFHKLRALHALVPSRLTSLIPFLQLDI